MSRTWTKALLTLGGVFLAGAAAHADVFVRAPFVRVRVGGPGVHVRAPFVNLFVPSGPPVVVPGPVFVAPPPRPVVPPMPPAKNGPAAKPQVQAAPQPENPDLAPPQPVKPVNTPTLEEFARNFQPKAGNYEVTILNPATKLPTPVRFSLPEGTPTRILFSRRNLEFQYGTRHFVRIELDRDGAQVTSRN